MCNPVRLNHHYTQFTKNMRGFGFSGSNAAGKADD
jgi:hypothetical protein